SAPRLGIHAAPRRRHDLLYALYDAGHLDRERREAAPIERSHHQAGSEVDRVLGKTGRADTPTDPAPLSMLETIVTLKPTSEWRTAPTWYSSWAPGWARTILRRITPDHISQEQLVRELDEAVDIPGLSNAWTMPVRARTGMLTTGIRTPIGLKISDGDVAVIDALGAKAEATLSRVTGARRVFAERTG